MKKYAEGAAALLLLLAAGGASAGDDGIPALLKFAEQQQAVPVVEKAPPTPQPVATRPKPAATARTDSARLTALNQVMQQQAETIRRLEQQLAAQAQAKSPVPAPTPKAEPVDIRPLVAALKGVRRAIATPPDLIAMAAALARQQRLVTEQDRQLQQLSRQLAAQRQSPGLVSDADKQAYAAGVSLGRDILKLQEENRRLGIEADRPRLLAGIVDTLAGKPRLDDAAINRALQAADAALQQAQQQRQQARRQDGKAYLADFAKQPGCKRMRSVSITAWITPAVGR